MTIDKTIGNKRDRNNTTPVVYEYMEYYSANNATPGNRPVLAVLYSAEASGLIHKLSLLGVAN